MTVIAKYYDDVRIKQAEEVDGEGVVTALVSIFSNVDLVGDRVLPGAFERSLREWEASGDLIPVIWTHSWNDPWAHVGRVLSARETQEGLEATMQFDLSNPTAAYVFKLVRERRVREWSFAYEVRRESAADDGANELLELSIIEVGPTLKGANPETRTLSAKTCDDERCVRRVRHAAHVRFCPQRAASKQAEDDALRKRVEEVFGPLDPDAELKRRLEEVVGPLDLDAKPNRDAILRQRVDELFREDDLREIRERIEQL